jgi:hypothetical protein
VRRVITHGPRNILAVLVIAAVLAPGGARAKGSGCSVDPLNCAPGSGSTGGEQPGGAGVQLGGGVTNQITPGNAGRRTKPRARRPPSGRRCTRLASTTTCTVYRNGRARQICVKHGARQSRCRAVRRRSGRATPRSRTAATANQGFLATALPQVGKIWNNGGGHCTGTLVVRGIMITAGHCLYTNPEVRREAANSGVDAPLGYLNDQGNTLEFTPNSAWNGNNPIVETTGLDAQTVYAPAGVWPIVRTWVPQCFADNNMQCDVGFAELAGADNNQYYVGDTVGYWPIRTEMAIPLGAHYYDVGYSASGVFRDTRNGYGNAQYFCDVSWNGERFRSPEVTSDVDNLATDDATKTADTTSGCQHMGGASGGPVFIELTDGSWAINGVNSSGPSNGRWGFAISWNHFGPTVTDLYCYVVGCTRASAARSTRRAVAGHPPRATPAAVAPPG